jgi:1-aminocyclopropane-1-carboxylate deaminase/D-cysteine desulfhydrase-like pyridoxal-dependent ACC family enzyme
MAALIGSVRRGKLTRNQNVVFLHTGGSSALFAYPDVIGGS